MRILIAIILLTYAGFSIYKFVVLSQLIKKIKGLNNINNYYAEILEYNDTTIKEKNYVWYKDGMFKINKITYDDSGVKKDENVIWIDSLGENKYYCNETDEKMITTKLENKEIYNGIQYVFSYISKKYNNLSKNVIRDLLNPFEKIIINENFINIKNNKEDVSYITENGLPYCYYEKGAGKDKIKEFKIEINNVTDTDIEIAYN